MNWGIPHQAAAAGAAFGLAALAFFVMLGVGLHQTVLMIPVALAWAAALLALRPMVPERRLTSLYFAFGVMALMLFFLHETYEYPVNVRAFPLIIGYAGIALSILDILSVTETRLGRTVSRVFGAALDEEKLTAPRLGRELLVFLTLGACLLAIWLFGFLITSPIFVFLWMLVGGRKPFLVAALGGVLTLAFIYGLFELVLRYELYLGVVTTWLIENLYY